MAASYEQTKNATVIGGVIGGREKSDGPLNLVGTEASGTSVHMARSTVDNRLDTLHVGLPGTVGASVGVGNLDTEGHALIAKITLSHFVAPPIRMIWLVNRACRRHSPIIADFIKKSKHFFYIFLDFFKKG